MTPNKEAAPAHHPVCDRKYPTLCDACIAEARRDNKEAAQSNRLADKWKRDFIVEMTERRDRVARSAESCTEGGWYRGQMGQFLALLDVVCAALAPPVAEQPMTEQEIFELVAEHEDKSGLWDGPRFSHDGVIGLARAIEARGKK
jgi:hypothetical protein